MKKLLLSLIGACFVLSIFAQTTNYALTNPSGSGYAEIIPIEELNNATQATIQFWLKPSEKVKDGTIFSQENMTIKFGDAGAMVVSDGSNVATFTPDMPLDKWTHITLVYNGGILKAFVNNVEQPVTGTLAAQLPEAAGACHLSKGFKGQLDEFRVWTSALEQKDFFWRNTLNKFNPNYDALVAYWKFDQDQCMDLVDYKLKYHGTFKNVSRVAVTDNPNFKYRVVSGYTSLLRFVDRPNINRDMFLMTNDVILLALRVQPDGTLFPEYPDNSCVPTNVTYLANFEGRTGVMNFGGAGAKMTAKSSHAPFRPNAQLANTGNNEATFAGWFYIENWVEGAKLLSKYKDAKNCIEVTLGSAADKSLIVNLNGLKATLKGKLQEKKWHYIGVYLSPKSGAPGDLFFNPIAIGVDFTNYDALAGLELSGEAININTVPVLADAPMLLGENFDGKMDEVMLWSWNRKGNAMHDAENPVELNVGSWPNIWLNAYWKGDDPSDIGKDSQSYLNIISHIKNYYKNYRGMKIRLGLIYSGGEDWHKTLARKENLDRLIADAKKYVKDCDGLDVDLEWSYAQWEYDVFNNIISRLSNEVMSEYRNDKIFSVSLHEVSYKMEKSLIPGIDYFTFQLYGPSKVTYDWNWYVNAHQKFIKYGFPKDKILLSYGILLVENPVEGYKELFGKYGMNNSNFNPDLNQWNCNGTIKYFNGVTQTKRKQDFIIDNDVKGTMYFDMGNDLKVSDHKSLIRAQNDVIASNVDTLITAVTVSPVSIQEKMGAKQVSLFTLQQDRSAGKLQINITPETLAAKPEYSIFTADGKFVVRKNITDLKTSVSLQNLPKGVYIITVSDGHSNHSLRVVY